MWKASFALAVLVAAPFAAQAKTFKLGDEKPVAEITMPDAWKTETADGGVEATSPDEATYLSAEAIDATDVAQAGKDTAEFLASQKIKVKPETKKAKEAKIAGLPTVEISWDATDEDGPTKISLLLVKIAADKVAVLTYWRSEAGEKDHGAEVDGIEKSLKPIK